MKTIGLIDVDGHNGHPNLALMKLSRYHKDQGDEVLWYTPFEDYDRVYMSKVFSFTPDYNQVMPNAKEIIKGGTGYDYTTRLPEEIDRLQPDYTIYPKWPEDTALGFLTRGCPNKCKWCVVPKKEEKVAPYMDIDDIMIEGKTKAVLMDNNILASSYDLEQIEKIVHKKIRVDFNQGLDARLVTEDVAKILAKVKWIQHIRFGCDTPKQIEECDRAVDLIRKYGNKSQHFSFYTIILGDIEECYQRIKHFRNDRYFVVAAQPYREPGVARQIIPQWQKDMAQWANRKEIFKKTDFKDFSPRQGFTCKEYFY